jgi:glycosyltransferase involved in cell wall biosynthesis
MKRVLLATDLPFWERLKGNQHRVFELTAFLAEHYSVTVFFMGHQEPESKGLPISFETVESDSRGTSVPWRILNSLPNRLRLMVIEFLNRVGYRRTLKSFYRQDFQEAFRRCCEKSDFDAVIVVYVWFGYLIEVVDPEKSLRIIDFQDLFHKRVESFGQLNRVPDKVITQEEEFGELEKFDYLLALQRADYDFLSDQFAGKLLLGMLPHQAVPGLYRKRLESVAPGEKLTLVYFGAFGDTSLDAIRWFIREAWTSELADSYDLHIYGTVCDALTATGPGVVLKGRVERVEDAYRNADVAINPARFGSGLKTRNIEAMAFGIPLLTTPVGAQGLEEHVGKLFLCATSAEEFRRDLIRLIDADVRRGLSEKSLAFVGQALTRESCFASLKAVIDEGPRGRG